MQPNDQNEALIVANRERLHVLELQAARYGQDAPPHIVNEISKIVATIRALSTVVDLTPDIDPNTDPSLLARDKVERRRDASTNEQATLRMIATVQATVAEVSNVKTALRQDVNRLEEQLDDAKERVNGQIASIEALVAAMQVVVLTEVQNIHTTIDRIVSNSLRAIGVIVLIIGLTAIGVIIYNRV